MYAYAQHKRTRACAGGHARARVCVERECTLRACHGEVVQAPKGRGRPPKHALQVCTSVSILLRVITNYFVRERWNARGRGCVDGGGGG